MAETDTHKRLKMVGSAYLKRICQDMVSMEIPFGNIKSIADVCGLNYKKKEVRIIEVKASYADYARDKKLFDTSTSYYPHCHYFYIMCPTGVIPKEKVLKEFGLLYVDEDNRVEVIQRPTKNRMTLKTRFDTTMKRMGKIITNQLLYKLYRCQEQTPLLKERKKRRARTSKTRR